MSHRSKSGQRAKRHQAKQKWKRAWKRKRVALLTEGKIKKGIAPQPSATA